MTEHTATHATLPIALVFAGLVGACGTVGGFPGHMNEVRQAVVEQAAMDPVKYCDQTGRVFLAGDHAIIRAMQETRDDKGEPAIRPCPRDVALNRE